MRVLGVRFVWIVFVSLRNLSEFEGEVGVGNCREIEDGKGELIVYVLFGLVVWRRDFFSS